jgi:hypothetical protein
MTPREGGTTAAGHTKLQLYYTYPTVGPKRHQVHLETRGGIERGTIGTGGNKGGIQRHQEDWRAPPGGLERAVSRMIRP